MAHRDSRVLALEAEINSAKESLAATVLEGETRLRETISFHSQQYKELNTAHLNLSTRAAALENKLEECGINPISLRPWDIEEEDQAKMDAEAAEMEAFAARVSATYEARNAAFAEIKAKYAELEAALPALLEGCDDDGDDEDDHFAAQLAAETDRMANEAMSILKELGIHVAAPLRDATKQYLGEPLYAGQQEEYEMHQQQVFDETLQPTEVAEQARSTEVTSSGLESDLVEEAEEPEDKENNLEY